VADQPKKVVTNSARPGIKGAVQDLVEAVATTFSPEVVRGRSRRRVVDAATDEATLGRMRSGQSTDSSNKY
jgi:hypothetical protein